MSTLSQHVHRLGFRKFFTLGLLGPKPYCRPLRASPPAAFSIFGYYANMVQHLEFIIHVDIQPLRQNLFTQGHISKVKFKVTIFPIFSVKKTVQIKWTKDEEEEICLLPK